MYRETNGHRIPRRCFIWGIGLSIKRIVLVGTVNKEVITHGLTGRVGSKSPRNKPTL